jgi:hypothetical protein
MGVEYVYASGGTYDRGGRNGNKVEAEKVADRHLKKDIPPKDFAEVMLKVVQNTLGLNKTEVFKETSLFGYGWERLGSVIKEKLEAAFSSLVRQNKIEMEEL